MPQGGAIVEVPVRKRPGIDVDVFDPGNIRQPFDQFFVVDVDGVAAVLGDNGYPLCCLSPVELPVEPESVFQPEALPDPLESCF